ncbi:hypothetical protein GCM10010178_90620 [Lentzea flava]|uniref:Uncharacterized protein n=1 Tax=Lentzea flava TaxID=103732 RepID=A0ABQ2VH14_9PSEU|nr:hypothetical protein GCM10010178_90620 [Lentzea flava]
MTVDSLVETVCSGLSALVIEDVTEDGGIVVVKVGTRAAARVVPCLRDRDREGAWVSCPVATWPFWSRGCASIPASRSCAGTARPPHRHGEQAGQACRRPAAQLLRHRGYLPDEPHRVALMAFEQSEASRNVCRGQLRAGQTSRRTRRRTATSRPSTGRSFTARW